MNIHSILRIILPLLFFLPVEQLASVPMPFRQVGNLILVEATVNDVSGEFILDTGAPELILNHAYFGGISVPWATDKIIDCSGGASQIKYLPLETFTIGNIEIKKQYGLVVDLTVLEKVKGTKVIGIIGYEVLKGMEVVFDFDFQVIEFTKAKRGGEPIFSERPLAELDLKFSGHIPYVKMKVGTKRLRMGIDTGAEVNVMHKAVNGKTKVELNKGVEVVLVNSISQKNQLANTGSVTGGMIGQFDAGALPVTLLSMTSLNNSLPVDLDGFLGIPFLKKGRIAINYKMRKLYIWPSEGTLVSHEAMEE